MNSESPAPVGILYIPQEELAKHPLTIKDIAFQSDNTTREFSPEMETAFLQGKNTVRATILEKLKNEWDLDALKILPASAAANIQEFYEPKVTDDAFAKLYKRLLGDIQKDDVISLAKELGISRGLSLGDLARLPRAAQAQIVFLLLTQESYLMHRYPAMVKKGIKKDHTVVKAKDLGTTWKELLKFMPADTMRYMCDLGGYLDLSDNRDIANLLLSTGKAYRDINPRSAKEQQPIGMLKYTNSERTQIKQLAANEALPFAVFSSETNKGTVVKWNPGMTDEEFRTAIDRALQDKKSWKALNRFESALIGFNVDRQDTLYSQKSVKAGFEGTREWRPFLVFSQGVSKRVRNRDEVEPLHLQAAFDHVACDGRLAEVFLRGLPDKESPVPKIKGVAHYFAEMTGRSILGEDRSKEMTMENYGDVVTFTLPEISAGADLCTYASLWGLNLYQEVMTEIEGSKSRWRKLNPNTPANFTVSRNPLAPLAAGSCWKVNNKRIPVDSPAYTYRHVIGLVNGLDGFKYTKYLIDTHKEKGTMPINMKLMELWVNSQAPDYVKLQLMRLNRSSWLTPLRNLIFPKTAIVEEDGLDHTTVAGRDMPNVVVNKKKGKTKLIYSIDPTSEFFRKNALALYVPWASRAFSDVIKTINEWKASEGTLIQLNDAMEQIYQDYKERLIKLVRQPKYVSI